MSSHGLDGFIQIEDDHVMAREVHLKAHDGWFLVVNWNFKNAPNCLQCRDVVTVPEFEDLISLLYLNYHTV